VSKVSGHVSETAGLTPMGPKCRLHENTRIEEQIMGRVSRALKSFMFGLYSLCHSCYKEMS
jgi:hypothetical protein